ncbi:valyl-tRNA synthetase, partial [Coccidioides immitis RMSCC 3703]
MKAAYPEYNSSFDDPNAEAAYDLVLATSKAIRSILSEYEIKTKGDIKIQTYNASSHKTIRDEVSSIKSLSGKYIGEISVLGPDNTIPPPGCVVSTVGANAAVYLEVSDE